MEKNESIYKVGDKVTIRKTRHPGFQGSDYPVLIAEPMLDECGGKTYTVKSVHQSSASLNKTRKGYLEPFWYMLEGGKEAEDLFWSAAMFEESNHLVKNKINSTTPFQIVKGEFIYLITRDCNTYIFELEDKKYSDSTFETPMKLRGMTNRKRIGIGSILHGSTVDKVLLKLTNTQKDSESYILSYRGHELRHKYLIGHKFERGEVVAFCIPADCSEVKYLVRSNAYSGGEIYVTVNEPILNEHVSEANSEKNKEMQCNKLTDKVYEILEELKFNDGYAVVQRKKDNKYNWIDKDKNLLSPDWFYWGDDFHEGYARVKRDEDFNWNWIDTNGKLLSTDWMQYCDSFKEGFASFKADDKVDRWNWIDKKGNILSKNWYYCCTTFNNGFAKVYKVAIKSGSSWGCVVNFVDKNGDLLSPIWFRDACSSFHEGCARVTRTDGMVNWLKEDGEFLSREWFRDCHPFKEGFASVVRKEYGNCNWIDKAGNILSKDKDFYDCGDFHDGFAEVIHKNGKSSWIGKDGKIYTTKEKDKAAQVIQQCQKLEIHETLIHVKKVKKIDLGTLISSNEINITKNKTKTKVKLNFN